MNNQPGRLRVSIVEPSGMLYGSELALLDILERLDRSRFAPEVILPQCSPFSERLRAANIPFRELLRPMAHQAQKFKKAVTYLNLAWHWWRHRPDLVYVNQGGILRPVAAIACWLDIPIVCQIQTLEDAKWVSSMTGIHNQISSFICNSKFIAAETKVPAERLSLLYYGYKPKGLPAKRDLSSKCPMEVGLLGRICEGKGHYLLVEVARRLKELNSTDYHFRFIGDAPTPAERSKIEGMVTSLGLQSLIEFRGYRKDIGAELAALDLMAIPSVAEPFGRIFCEAAEARLPVLVSDGGGLGELAKHFRAGSVFASGDVDDFLAKMDDMRTHYEMRRQEFDVAATRMLTALDLGAYVGVLAQILEAAAARRPVAMRWRGINSESNNIQP